MSIVLELADEAATARLGAALARVLKAPLLVGLSGDLGAGKTTLARALVDALLPGTRVKSPTYTLVESYALPAGVLHHLDLYRIDDAEELEALGLDDLLSSDAIVLVEWPAKGAGVLPGLDLDIGIAHRPEGRTATISALTGRGQGLLEAVQQVVSIERDRTDLSCRSEKTGAGRGF
jgi:tRNA threonylcarbamoyladenosine biosynthesis protein TsaE